MKEKLNKNETMLSSVMQLRPSTKEKHPDDCRPMNFQFQFSFVKYYWVTSFNDHS